MVYMNIEGDEIISTSPETLVKLQNGVLNTFPIDVYKRQVLGTQLLTRKLLATTSVQLSSQQSM